MVKGRYGSRAGGSSSEGENKYNKNINVMELD
jgi:hypothetical protein